MFTPPRVHLRKGFLTSNISLTEPIVLQRLLVVLGLCDMFWSSSTSSTITVWLNTHDKSASSICRSSPKRLSNTTRRNVRDVNKTVKCIHHTITTLYTHCTSTDPASYDESRHIAGERWLAMNIQDDLWTLDNDYVDADRGCSQYSSHAYLVSIS